MLSQRMINGFCFNAIKVCAKTYTKIKRFLNASYILNIITTDFELKCFEFRVLCNDREIVSQRKERFLIGWNRSTNGSNIFGH